MTSWINAMTKEETTKLLAVFQVAYPNAFKNFNVNQADAMATLWASRFANVDYEIMQLITYKIIDTSEFMPSIATVRRVLQDTIEEYNNKLTKHLLYKSIERELPKFANPADKLSNKEYDLAIKILQLARDYEIKLDLVTIEYLEQAAPLLEHKEDKRCLQIKLNTK